MIEKIIYKFMIGILIFATGFPLEKNKNFDYLEKSSKSAGG